tara:strand:+ start:1767 stop:2114 length:348 start_codon:yes stop_codon:yes gene_type:complete
VLLRGSGEHRQEALALEGIMPDLETTTGFAGEDVLAELADAFYAGDLARLVSARTQVRSRLGDDALIDAAGIIGMFDAVVRIADGTGVPLEDVKAQASATIRPALGIDRFHPDKR